MADEDLIEEEEVVTPAAIAPAADDADMSKLFHATGFVPDGVNTW